MLVKVIRPYSGQEGKRVRIGTELFVQTGKESAPDGVAVISVQRYRDLARVGLVEKDKLPNDEKPSSRTSSRRAAPPAGKPKSAEVAKARKQQARNPAEKGKDPTSIRVGNRNAPSSSVVVPASEGVTSKPRGKRGERAGSPSTTPTASSQTQMSSMPQTPPGGDNTGQTSVQSQEPPLA